MRHISIVIVATLFLSFLNCNTIIDDIFTVNVEEKRIISKNIQENPLKHTLSFLSPVRDYAKFYYNSDIFKTESEIDALFKSGNLMNHKLAKLLILHKDENVRSVVRTWYSIKSLFSFNKHHCNIRFDYEEDRILLQAEILFDYGKGIW